MKQETVRRFDTQEPEKALRKSYASVSIGTEIQVSVLLHLFYYNYLLQLCNYYLFIIYCYYAIITIMHVDTQKYTVIASEILHTSHNPFTNGLIIWFLFTVPCPRINLICTP